MDLERAFLAAAAAAALLLSACGGSGVSDVATSANAGSTGGPSVSRSCAPQTTVVGGNLFVAEQGPVGVTLLDDGGLGPLIFDNVDVFGRGFMLLYDNVFGLQASHPQDTFGFAKPFPPGTPAGASTQVELQAPAAGLGVSDPVASTYPKGIPVQVWLKLADGNPPTPANSSATAAIGKDVWPTPFPTASVTYGANNTATVTLFPTSAGAHFSVRLTNVFGTGCTS